MRKPKNKYASHSASPLYPVRYSGGAVASVMVDGRMLISVRRVVLIGES